MNYPQYPQLLVAVISPFDYFYYPSYNLEARHRYCNNPIKCPEGGKWGGGQYLELTF